MLSKLLFKNNHMCILNKKSFIKKNYLNFKFQLSWVFLVVNSCTDSLISFFFEMKKFGHVVLRKNFLGEFNSNKNHVVNLKGVNFVVDFYDEKSFLSFFNLYQKNQTDWIFNLITKGFFFENFFYLFNNKKNFQNFKKSLIEPLKSNSLIVNFSVNLFKVKNSLYVLLNKNFLNFFLQINLYNLNLKEKINK